MSSWNSKVHVGAVFYRLTVESFSRKVITASGGQLNYWNCRCECGNLTEVTNRNLTSGHTRSCGCLLRQIGAARAIHGFARVGQVHPLHGVWRKILDRCDNPNIPCFVRYGARGITMCQGWRDFVNFAADMMAGWRRGLTVERMDNNGNYSCGKCPQCIENGWPMNCRWATWQEQANNKSTSRFITFNGRRMTVTQWARELGLCAGTILARLYRGYDDIDALTKPIGNNRGKSIK